ncbi:MAG: hypothetical protein M1831_002341 [Alyxoria varia]|nr:MAG: hypothetical protein M1831_002341 [Alyxoria varia]
MLRNDPINVEVQGENVLLEPIDKTKDVPDSWKSVIQAMKLMGKLPSKPNLDSSHLSQKQPRGKAKKLRADHAIPSTGEAEDASTSRGTLSVDSETLHTKWMQLLPLLNGMRAAGRKFKPWQLARIVRQAGEAGASHVVFFAAKQAHATGLYLQDIRVVREVFWTYRLKALHDSLQQPPQLEVDVKRNWQTHTDALRNARRAFSQAEQTANLLEERHNWGEPPNPDRVHNPRDLPFISQDPRKAPEIIGVMVEIAARWANKARMLGSNDEQMREPREYLEMYVDRLLANLQDAAYTVVLPRNHDDKYRTWQRESAATIQNQEREEGMAATAPNAVHDIEEVSTKPTSPNDEHPSYRTNLKAAVADGELLNWTPVWHGLRLATRILEGQTKDKTKDIQRMVDGMEYRLRIARDVVVTNDQEGWAGKMEEKRRGVRWFDEAANALA